ncbi:MAG: PT domain-containing protein [Clostridia bacterium]
MLKSRLRTVSFLLVIMISIVVFAGCNLLPGQTPTPTAAPMLAPTGVPTAEPTHVPVDPIPSHPPTAAPTAASVEDTVFAYLDANVPEIAAYGESLIRNKGGKLIMRLDGTPDETSSDEFAKYFQIYVGEDLGDHVTRWYSFYVNATMDKIMVEDVVSGELISLAAWRKTL